MKEANEKRLCFILSQTKQGRILVVRTEGDGEEERTDINCCGEFCSDTDTLCLG